MAEAFARSFGGDILVARSAGILPSRGISSLSRRAMAEKNIPIRKRAPRLVSGYDLSAFDLVVNMTGRSMTFAGAGTLLEWQVADPAGEPLASHRAARDRIEKLVRNLVANLRYRDGFAPRRDRAHRATHRTRTLLLPFS
jgi:protein-tyrosine-phosphatase